MTLDLTKILADHKEFVRTGNETKRANLRGVYLQRANLRGADLRGADLREADLRGANLQGANLHRADLRGANLQGANLQGAYLRRAYLHRADLRGADLREVDLGGAYLRGANLQGADLQGADLQGAYLEFTTVRTFNFGAHFAFYHEGYLKIGCQGMSLDDWLIQYKEAGDKEGYTPKQIEDYGIIIKAIKQIEENKDV